MNRAPGNTITLGKVEGTRKFIALTPEIRSTHLYICGSTGTGKSKLLEHLIRQDIAKWHESKCGMILLDPHGSLFDSLLNYVAWNDSILGDVPIVPIDLRRTDWTVGYNLLRSRPKADPAVIINYVVQAMAYVWGESGTERTPRFARWASNVLRTLYEKKRTLIEAEHLVNLMAKHQRYALTGDLAVRSVAQDWAYANSLQPKDFDTQISSTVNRLHNFLGTEKLRLMFGQMGASLDFSKALEEGSIILVNLSSEGAQVSEEDASLFATLLLTDLWTAAKERGKGMDGRDVKPFYVYIDEFQNFVTPTIAKNLDQARGFGLHLTLANQFPRQILHAGANGAQVYDSVMANARSKVVFETRGEENLRPLALDLFMGVMDPDEIQLKLYSTKVMGYEEQTRTITSENESWSSADGHFDGTTLSAGLGGSIVNNDVEDPNAWNTSEAESTGASHMETASGSKGSTEVPFLMPIVGKEVSNVQFRKLNDQIFMAMAALSDQKQRHGVVRLKDTRRPVTIVTPTITPTPADRVTVESLVKRLLAKLPFALPSESAAKQIADREAKFAGEMYKGSGEPETAIRIIKAAGPVSSPEPPHGSAQTTVVGKAIPHKTKKPKSSPGG